MNIYVWYSIGWKAVPIVMLALSLYIFILGLNEHSYLIQYRVKYCSCCSNVSFEFVNIHIRVKWTFMFETVHIGLNIVLAVVMLALSLYSYLGYMNIHIWYSIGLNIVLAVVMLALSLLIFILGWNKHSYLKQYRVNVRSSGRVL